MPLSMPSDIIMSRALEDGNYDIEIVQAEQRFWVTYKHVHGIKFQVVCFVVMLTNSCSGLFIFIIVILMLNQALALCNGLIGDLSGIVLGIRHDAHLFEESQLDARLHDLHINLLRRDPRHHLPFTALADSAYAETLYIKRVLGGHSPEANLLSALRCPVEWSFCKLFREFRSLKTWRANKIFARQALTEKFVCCAIFSNMLSCVQGNQTANWYGVSVPTLDSYMSFQQRA